MNELCSEHHTTHLFDHSYIVLNSTWFFVKIDQYPKIILLLFFGRIFFLGGGGVVVQDIAFLSYLPQQNI